MSNFFCLYWDRLETQLDLTWIGKKALLKSASRGETTCSCIQNIQRGIMQRDYSSLEQSHDFKFPALIYIRDAPPTSLPCAIGKAFAFPAAADGWAWPHLHWPLVNTNISELPQHRADMSLLQQYQLRQAASKVLSLELRENGSKRSPLSCDFSWPLVWQLLFWWMEASETQREFLRKWSWFRIAACHKGMVNFQMPTASIQGTHNVGCN